MSETSTPNVCGPTSGSVENVIAASTIVLTTLRSAGSTVPGLALAAEIALRILTLVQEVNDNDIGFVDLANDACGLVYTLVVECRRIINNGQRIPDHIQRHIQTLSGNLVSIEIFTKKKLKRSNLRKMMSHSKDVADIARYRDLLRQSLDVYGLQSNISIQEYLQQLMDQIQKQRQEMERERRARLEEERRAKEAQASQAAIQRIQEEDRVARMADDVISAQRDELLEIERAHEKRKRAMEIARLKQSQADELKRIQEDNAYLEHERQALRQRTGRTPSPQPQDYLFPSPIPPMSPYMYNPYSYSAQHLPPPQPFYSQPQGGISLQHVSGSNISINSPHPPPVIHNINSGNISNVSISNVNNHTTSRRKR